MSYPAFLAAIRDNPEDDLPRLVCADWLDDHGQHDRAEFIRVQLELSRGVSPRSRARELLVRLRALIREHRTRWLGLLASHAPDSVFERGFVESVRLISPVLLQHGPALFDEHPIHRLTLYGVTIPKWPAVARSPCLGCLTALDLRESQDGDALGALGGSPHLGRLRALDLRSTNLTDKGLAQLLAGGLPALERLNVAGNRLGPAGAVVLAAANLSALTELNLGSTGMNDDSARALAGSPRLAALRSLRVSYNPLTEAGVRALLESPRLPALQQLEVSANEIDAEARGRLRRDFGNRLVW
jgi:uncharacterized protein (TIGR02996 family)